MGSPNDATASSGRWDDFFLKFQFIVFLITDWCVNMFSSMPTTLRAIFLPFPDRQCATFPRPFQSISFMVRSKKKIVYWSTERPSTPAGNSTCSKMLFCDFEMQKNLPSCEHTAIMPCGQDKTHLFIPALLIVTGSWNVARKNAVFVVTNARMRTWGRKMARLYEPAWNLLLAKNIFTLAERNVLAPMNIRRGAWKIVGSPACMQSVVYVVQSPVLLVRNHADGQHSFSPICYMSFLISCRSCDHYSCPVPCGSVS